MSLDDLVAVSVSAASLPSPVSHMSLGHGVAILGHECGHSIDQFGANACPALSTSISFDDRVNLGPTLRFGCCHSVDDRTWLIDKHDEHVWLGILEATDDAAA